MSYPKPKSKSQKPLELKGVAVGDLHLERFSNAYFNGILKDPIHEQLEALRQACDFAIANKRKNVFLLGDIVDHPHPKQETIVRLLSLFKSYSDLHFWMITGNHDITARGRNGLIICEFLSSANILKNVSVFTDQKMMTVDGFPVYFMPYGFNDQPKGAYLGIAHHSVVGAKADNGYTIKREEGINIESSKAKWIIGHIHLYQKFKWGLYPGTLYQVNFGENLNKSFSDFKATLHMGEVKLVSKAVPVKNVFRLKNVAIKEEADLKKIPFEDRLFLKLKIFNNVRIPSEFLVQNQHVILTEIVGKKGEVSKIVAPVDAPDTVFEMTETTGLKEYLLARGMPKDRTIEAIKLVKRMTKAD